MNKISRLDFTGQQVYVGMDIHKKSWSISILMDNFEHKTFTQPPDVEVLMNYLKRNFPGGSYKSVYEAGYCGFWIHDRLQKHGVAWRSWPGFNRPSRRISSTRMGIVAADVLP